MNPTLCIPQFLQSLALQMQYMYTKEIHNMDAVSDNKSVLLMDEVLKLEDRWGNETTWAMAFNMPSCCEGCYCVSFLPKMLVSVFMFHDDI